MEGVLSLVMSKQIIIYILTLAVTWSANDFLYIGGHLNVENLAGNQFLNFAIIGMTEMPSVFVGEFLCNRFGRRWSHFGCMTLATLCFAAIIPIAGVQSLGWLVTLFAVTAKAVGNVGWFINYVQTMEIFPTCARVSGSNMSSSISLAFCTVAPYVILLGNSDIKAMYGIFAFVGFVGMIATTLVPETYMQEFPECIADVKKRQKHPYLSWKVWKNPKGTSVLTTEI
eukprot:maker-scaffold111_size354240-snap-gene-0.15 protein:Tk11896 transcript:maker-scaffold111_size354240-snap-gene-0.15-mRNA-1 annotation:"solute carrier family 22 member 1"